MNYRHAACFLLLLIFSSCFEISEEFTISESGAGEYAMKIDMFRMIEMMSSLDENNTLEDDKDYDEIRDTTVYFRKEINGSRDLTPEEKRLLEHASMRMRMHLKEKDFYFQFLFPFKKSSDLSSIYNLTPKAMSSMDYDRLSGTHAHDSAGLEDAGDADRSQARPSADMASANPYFDIITGKGFFEKKLRREEWKKHAETDSTFIQMAGMMGGIYVTTVVRLPRPVKKCDHPYAVLSDDRKTITFKFPFSDYMERPEVLSFRVEY